MKVVNNSTLRTSLNALTDDGTNDHAKNDLVWFYQKKKDELGTS